MKNIVACVTTRNEVESIGPLVDALRALDMKVVVVDDASTDGTAGFADYLGAHVTRNEHRLGIGPSLLAAWRRALELGANRVLQIDAGGSHDPQDCATLLASNAEVVIGSRFIDGARYEGRPWRAVMSRAAAMACNMAQAGAHWQDWTSGFRCFSRRALVRLLKPTYSAKMHAFQIEVLARAGEAGLSIEEVPITYTAGRSAFNWKVMNEAVGVWLDVLNHYSGVDYARGDGVNF
jgi:dolichol-phosphate mannosyltransferase